MKAALSQQPCLYFWMPPPPFPFLIRYSVKGTSAEGPSFAVTYSPIVPNLSYGSSPIEDIVQLSGSVCVAEEHCTAVTARGWGQLIGGQFPTA